MSIASSRIQPCLWFDDTLEEAVRFYTAIFPRSSIDRLTRLPGRSGEPARVMVAEFTLDGLTFRGINGGPDHARFTDAVSFQVMCRDQSEVDYFWDSLVDGGEESVCGWLKDRFGLSWQVVPSRLYELVADPDPRRAQAVGEALLRMRRIVIADLELAADMAQPAG